MGKRKITFTQRLRKAAGSFADKSKFALLGYRSLLSSWTYALLSLLFALLFLYILAQLQEGGYSWGLLWSGLPAARKIGIFWDSWLLIGNCFTSLGGLSLVLLAIMQALALSGIIYALRHRQKEQALNTASTGGIASILAFVTLGCPTCGLSLLTPILTMFAGTGAVAMAERLGWFLTGVAFLLLIYTIVQLGYIIFVDMSAAKTAKKEEHAKSN